MRQLLTIAIASTLLSVARPCLADDDNTISTDRPNITNSPDVVGTGTIQLETGLSGVSTTGLHASSTPTMLRLGVGDSIELRLSGNGRESVHGGGVDTSGWGGYQLGAKWHISGGTENGAPAMALIATVIPSSGSAAFRVPGTRTEVDMPLNWDLGGGYSLGVMPGVYHDHDATGRSGWGSVVSASVGHDLAEHVQGFAELAALQLAPARLGGNIVAADIGATWQPQPNWQLDFALFRGISHDAPDWQWSIGGGIKF